MNSLQRCVRGGDDMVGKVGLQNGSHACFQPRVEVV